MSARDRWTVDLKCPACGKVGMAELSQEDGWAFMRNQSTSVDSVPAGFDYKIEQPMGQPQFYCKEHPDRRA